MSPCESKGKCCRRRWAVLVMQVFFGLILLLFASHRQTAELDSTLIDAFQRRDALIADLQTLYADFVLVEHRPTDRQICIVSDAQLCVLYGQTGVALLNLTSDAASVVVVQQACSEENFKGRHVYFGVVITDDPCETLHDPSYAIIRFNHRSEKPQLARLYLGTKVVQYG